MKNLLCFLFILFAQILLARQSLYDRDRTEEYVGCFLEDIENRVFSHASGDYRVNELSPIQCMVVCGRKYKYAAIQNGKFCMCADKVPSNRTNEADCSTVCPGTLNYPSGETKPKCGGLNTISVYSIKNRILGMKILDPGPVRIFEKTSFGASITNGLDSTFTFDFGDGDGSKPLFTSTPNISHIYDRPGKYELTLKAKNNISGILETRRGLNVIDDLEGVAIECPTSTVVGRQIECNGTMSRGADINAEIDFGDGTRENIYISPKYSSVGRKIPTFKTLETAKRSTAATFVIPSSEFKHEETITHWEIDAIVAGNVLLQVFRPSCNSDEKFCLSNHSCISAAAVCEPMSQFSCGSNEIYCMYRGRCIPHTTKSMSTCEANPEYHFTSTPADYSVVYQHKASISATGHHVLKLSDTEIFKTKPGDVIGWSFSATSSIGQVAYATIPEDSNDPPEYQYPLATQVGSKLLRANGVKVKSHHIISAHFNRKAEFTLRHVYNNTGAYMLMSKISPTVVIYADTPIAGVQLVCPGMVTTNSTHNVNIPAHSGSNTTYEWSTGDSREATKTIIGEYLLIYKKPGVYRFSLSAYNSLGRITKSCIVKVLDMVSGLEFLKPVDAVALGQDAVIAWTAQYGTNVSYTLDFGDGSPKKTYDMTGKLDNKVSVHHRYQNVGKYNITVEANSIIGPKLIVSTITKVQVPLRNLRFFTDLPHVSNRAYVAIGDKVELKVLLEQGSNPMCTYNFGDGTADYHTDLLGMKHVYSKLGEYVANITCLNDISVLRASLNATIIVQELQEITGIILKGNSTAFGNSTLFLIQMQTGSMYICDWNFGDGSKYKTDFKMNQMPIAYKYRSVGDYKVNVICFNRLGAKSANITISVEVPIAGFEVQCPGKYLRVDEPFEVRASTPIGSRLEISFQFGEGESKKIVNKNSNEVAVAAYSYKKPGIYNLQITARNKYSSNTRDCPQSIKAEYPVSGVRIVTNSPIKFDNGIAEYRWFPSPDFVSPTDAVMSWDFGDGQSLSRIPISFTNLPSVISTHKYNTTGVFITKVKIENNVSSITFDLEIDVQEMLPISLSFNSRDRQSKLTSPGYGIHNDFFPIEKDLLFTVTKQPKDRWYFFDFGDGNTLNSTNEQVVYAYPRSGKYNVTVKIYNVLQQMTKRATITVQSSIKNMDLNVPSVVHLKTSATFTIMAESMGSSACYILNLGDGNITVFNNTVCSRLIIYSMNKYVFKPLPSASFKFNHTYAAKGVYNVSLEARNFVSFGKVIKSLEVIYKPCAMPSVNINGGGSLQQPRVILRSDRIIMRANVTFDCDKASHVIYTWSIFKVQEKGNAPKFLNSTRTRLQLPLTENSATKDPTIYEIREKQLGLGINMIKLTVTFESGTHDVSDIVSSDSIWTDIQATPLKAIIKGGVRRAVGYEMTYILDGSGSYDPDGSTTDHRGMEFQWYCRRKDETFSNNYTTINPNSGCFKNGQFNLTKPSQSLVSANLQTGRLVQMKSYVLRLVMKKDTRISWFDQEIQVLPGRPPSMDIKCKMNCLEKLNPAERLIVESMCTDCSFDTTLSYKWSLLEVSTTGVETEVTNIATKTTTGVNQANIAIVANVLKPGEEYNLKVSAWKPGGEKDGVGFIEYRFKVNRPPHSGVCSVEPRSGFSLTTKFQVICNSWIDDDLPLTYQIDVLRGGNLANLYNGLETKVETVLPIGDAALNYEMDIIAMVSDKYGYSARTNLKVQVKEPPTVDMGAVSDDLAKLSESGNLQALTQQAVAAGSVMNKGSTNNATNDNATNEAIEARTKILLSVSKVKVCDLSQIRQMGDVYNEMTGKPDEVSQDAQDASSSAMDGMSDCMLKSNPQDPGVKAAALTMLQGSSKLLQANMARASKNASSNSTANSTVDPATANASSKVLDTVTKVGGSLMRQLVAGDKPTKMSLPNMDVEMSQVAEDADEDDAGFKLPSMTSLLGNQTSDGTKKSVGAMVSSMAKSPYGSDSSSADIKSNVMGLALTDGSGNPVDLAGQELQMFVKRDASNDMPAEMNTFGESGVMRFHKFNYSSFENGVAFEVRPMDPKLQVKLFLAYGKRPSVTRFQRNHTFMTIEEAQKRKAKLPNPFTYVISNGELNSTGEYYVGLKAMNRLEIYAKYGYTPLMNYTLRIFETKCKVWDDDLKTWTSKGCKVGAKTTFNSTQCICKLESEQEVSASGQPISTVAPTTGQAGSFGAQSALQPVRKVKKVVKRVSFAGGFFVAPNPIDFDKAFAGFANLAENPVAFSTVLAIFGVYLIMLFWARREDRKDLLKAGVTVLEDNESSDRQFYEITVFTGFGNSAGTTSRVFIQLSGEDSSSEPRELIDSNRDTFRKRGQDVFLASFEDFLGDLTYIRIWHDNSGKKPSWYLSKVAITDLNTNKKYLFINEAWLAVEEGDGSIEKVLPVAGPEEIASFNHLFYSTTQKNLTDSHIWFSVFIRPAKSRFTRVQRLSCCLTLIYCTMLTNAMFYEIGGTSDPSTTLKLGPFEFSAAQIGIGVMSSLVIFPVNLLIVGVFRSVGPKPSKEELSKKKSRPFWWLYDLFFCFEKKKSQSEFMDIITSVPDSEMDLKKKASSKSMYEAKSEVQLESGDIGLRIENDDKTKSSKKSKPKKPKKKLPYWMKYFAWILLVLTSFTAAFFVVLYGFQFGKDKSAQWLSSMMISFVQDVFVSQPIKILLLGLFVALIVKKPTEEEEEDNKKKKDEDFLNEKAGEENGEDRRRRPGGIIKFQPPPKEKIQSARELRLKEIKMYGIVKDIFIYAVFVIALCTVSYNHVDPRSYMLRKGLEDNLVSAAYDGEMEFTSIASREDYWQWLNSTVVNGLFSTHWYNDDPNIPGFTQDLYNNLFGGARIRQLRVKPNTCKVPEEVTSFTNSCNDWYSWENEDTNHYDLNWKPIGNESLFKPPASYRSWEYMDSSELDTYPFMGEMALYSGGGYVGDLGKYPAKSYKLINELVKHNWFDSGTRAVFLEATVYNAQVNLFAITNFVVEFLPTNGIEHYYSIKIARLYTYGGSTESFVIACQFFVLFFMALFVYREGKKIYKEKRKYFKGFWNWVELLMIILVLSTVSIYFSRMMLVNSAVSKIHSNPGKFTSFNKVAKWDDMMQCVLSILVMVSCIKSIRLLQFNKTISLLASTLKGSAQPLSAFSVVFLVFYFAYVVFGFIIFVNYLEDFRSFITSMESTLGLLLGSFEFEDIRNARPIIGPFYFITLMILGMMYILNVFMTIIMDVYADVKRDLSLQSNEYEIVDFMIGRFKRFVGIQPGGQNKSENDSQASENSLMINKGAPQLKEKLHRKNKEWKKFLENDDEISKKFKQLDKSLNGFCKDDFAEDKLVDGIIQRSYGTNGGASGMRNEMNFNEYVAEAEYQKELYDELNKWN